MRHASHQGWGKWEVNPAQVLTLNAAEYRQLFLNANVGRYTGQAGRTGPFGAAPPINTALAPIYSLANFDGARVSATNAGVNTYARPGPREGGTTTRPRTTSTSTPLPSTSSNR